MPNKPKDHSAMQASICALCFLKPKTLRNISASISSLIVKSIFPYFEDMPWLPTHICGGCYMELNRLKKDPCHLVKHIDYISLTPPTSVSTRSMTSCLCSVCHVGRLSGGDYMAYKVKVSRDHVICSLCYCSYGKGFNHECLKA